MVLVCKYGEEAAQQGRIAISRRLGLSIREVRRAERSIARKLERFAAIMSAGTLCVHRDPAIAALAAGSASEEQVLAARVHLHACPVCRAAYKERLRTDELARKLAELLPAPPLLADTRHRGAWEAVVRLGVAAVHARRADRSAGDRERRRPGPGHPRRRQARRLCLAGATAVGGGALCVNSGVFDGGAHRPERSTSKPHHRSAKDEARLQKLPAPVAAAVATATPSAQADDDASAVDDVLGATRRTCRSRPRPRAPAPVARVSSADRGDRAGTASGCSIEWGARISVSGLYGSTATPGEAREEMTEPCRAGRPGPSQAVAGIAALLSISPAARAGTYTISGTCGLWDAYNYRPDRIAVYPECYGLVARNVGGPFSTPAGAAGGWSFSAPAGTSIDSFSLQGSMGGVQGLAGNRLPPRRRAQRVRVRELPRDDVPGRRASTCSITTYAGAGAGAVVLRVRCGSTKRLPELGRSTATSCSTPRRSR